MFESHKNTYYHTCKYCGANLDPGESCDCSGYSEVHDEDKTNNEKQEEIKHETASADGRRS